MITFAKTLRVCLALAVLTVAAIGQAQGDLVKTSISFNKDRYARGTLLTGTTTSRDNNGNGSLVTVPGRVYFWWSSDIRGQTPLGSLYTTTGQTSIGNLGFYIPTNPLDDNVKLWVQWVPDVPTFLGEPTRKWLRVPIGT